VRTKKSKLIFLIISLGLAFCANQDHFPKKELIIGIEASPSILDPRLARDAYAVQIIPLIFPGLFTIGKDLAPEPNLVSEYKMPNDTTYIFRLKAGYYFPDGKELKAKDVRATLESLSHPDMANSPYSELSERIKNIAEIDQRTLKIELKEPYAPFLVELNLGILPLELAHQALPLKPESLMGAGAYQVQEFEPGAKLVLIKNPYYQISKPYLEKIIFRILPDDTTRVLSLEKGEIQILTNPIPVDELSRLKAHPRLKVLERPGLNYTYLGFNLRDPILSKLEVRKAIAYSINRKELIDCLLKSTVLEANSLLSPKHWAYEPEVIKYDYNPELAKKLLDQAGLQDPDGDGPKPRFKLLYKTSQVQQRIWLAEAIAHQLAKVGIEVEVRSLEWGTLFSDIQAGNFQIYTLTWTGVVEPDIFYTIFHSQSLPPKGANRGAYSNPKLDQILEQARKTHNFSERKALYSQAQKILSQDLPYISLWHSIDLVAQDKKLLGFEPAVGGEWTGLIYAEWEQ